LVSISDPVNKIIITGDGSNTIYIPELDEHYHSVHGAIQESEHIFIKNGLLSLNLKEIRILEAGFGTGLNVLLTLLNAREKSIKIQYTSVEKYPITHSDAMNLNYGSIIGNDELFSKIHTAPWDTYCEISDRFFLRKTKADLKNYLPDQKYDLIYFDAFGPDKQPGVWNEEIFSRFSNALSAGGILVTYSAKGIVKRNLRSAGFKVTLLPGPPGKRHITRAIKT